MERAGTTSVYRLINAAGEIVGEGLPGTTGTLAIPGVVSLDLAASTFAGSGDTAVMRPAVTFGPEAVGVYNVRFESTTRPGAIQADDVLGLFRVLPVGWQDPVQDLTLTGPTHAPAGAT